MNHPSGPLALLAGLAALVVLAVPIVGGGLAWASDPPPPGATIVAVTGNRDTGFVVEHYDGTRDFPPTVSEGVAECREHARRVARVRCRTALRVWYRDLGRLRRALDHAHASG
jgi:hypothetical protein